MEQVFVSWSGGKDSCFAGYRAANSGLQVRYLVNMMTEDGQRSWTHGLSNELLRTQSQAIGIPLLQGRSAMATYEADFKKAILPLKAEGISGGVFGDIDLDEHRQWVEGVCQQIGVTAHLPLWGLSQQRILEDFIALGFEAVIVALNPELIAEEWLGRRVDRGFARHLAELGETKGVTPCGEAGEYHTLVTDGPLFNRRIEIRQAERVFREGYWFLDIQQSRLRAKR